MNKKKLNPAILEDLEITQEDFELKKRPDGQKALAQALYTAFMTDTLIEDQKDAEDAEQEN